MTLHLQNAILDMCLGPPDRPNISIAEAHEKLGYRLV